MSRNRAANQLRASPRAKSNPLGILISRGAFPQRCRGLHNLAFEPLASAPRWGLFFLVGDSSTAPLFANVGVETAELDDLIAVILP
jgi:hypothetical protein